MRTFADGSKQPTDSDLEAQLAGAWAPMKTVLELAGPFQRDWTFSNSSGWMLKVHDGQKALLYLIPLRGSFAVSMAIREAEREALLADAGVGDGVHEQLGSARQSAEGFALRFDICDQDDLADTRPFLEALVRLRREATS